MSGTLDIAAERARHPEVFRGKGWLRWLLLGSVFSYLLYLMWRFDFGRPQRDPAPGVSLLHPAAVRRAARTGSTNLGVGLRQGDGSRSDRRIMAIAVAETGVLAKLFAEAVETIDRNQVDGITSVGAGFIARLRFAVLPQVLPLMISQTLYSIESNSREATILGLVGAGGIGLRLSERIQINAWDQVAYVIVLILISVTVIDTASRYLRLRLIGTAS